MNYQLEKMSDRIIVRVSTQFSSADATQCREEMRKYLEQMETPSQLVVVFDFRQMKASTLTSDDMKSAAELMHNFGFKCLISLPPQGTGPEVQKMTKLLNQSIPIFHHNGIYVFIVELEVNVDDLVKKITNEEFHYQIEQKGSAWITYFPENLINEVAAQYLVEIDDIIKEKGILAKGGLVLDFSQMHSSTMDIKQMEKFVDLLASHHFKSIISIPPKVSTHNNSQVIQLLNKSFTLFNKRGMRIDFADNIEEADATISRFQKK